VLGPGIPDGKLKMASYSLFVQTHEVNLVPIREGSRFQEAVPYFSVSVVLRCCRPNV